MSGLNLAYAPPGPVAGAYFADTSEVSAIMGPVGSGKTRASIAKILYRAANQRRSPLDGVRYSRWVVVRETYRQIQRTVLKSWFKQVPRAFGRFIDGGSNAPSTHHLRFRLGDSSVVDCEVIFAAIGDQDVEEFCRGFEVTGGYLNEMDLLSSDLLQFLPDRAGRYPDMEHGGPTWCGIIADLNAPDTDSWVYRDFFEAPREGYRIFVQPGGRDPGAENLPNLPPGYYERAVRGKRAWYVRRMIDNRFGFSRHGKPVYEEEYNDLIHASPVELEPVRGIPLVIGADPGLRPGGAILQQMPDGQWRIIDELVGEGGAVKFSNRLNRLLAERYAGWSYDMIQGWCDPYAKSRSAAEKDESSWLDIVRTRTKLRWKIAPSNAIGTRLDAVRGPLTRLIDGHKPGLLVSPRCKVIRKGFNSGYAYKRVRSAGSEIYEDMPDKNEFSDPHDAVQYAILGGGGLGAVLGRERERELAAEQAPASGGNDYDPFSW